MTNSNLHRLTVAHFQDELDAFVRAYLSELMNSNEDVCDVERDFMEAVDKEISRLINKHEAHLKFGKAPTLTWNRGERYYESGKPKPTENTETKTKTETGTPKRSNLPADESPSGDLFGDSRSFEQRLSGRR